MTFSFVTLGCKVNQYESGAMAERLVSDGFKQCGNGAPDIIVINSCTVTAASDQKVRQALHKARRENPGAVVVLTGCMTQAFPERAEEWAGADIILGNTNRSGLTGHIVRFIETHEKIIEITPHDSKFEEVSASKSMEKTRAYIKIEDGCDCLCSYCIIPYARGGVRSRTIDEIHEEAVRLADNGFKEIVLVGINLSAYGQDTGKSLCDAMEAAASVDGIERVRLGSLEPDLLDNVMIEQLAKNKKLCPHFHLSLQSGCDETLRRMNRRYESSDYNRITEKLRTAFPDCSLTTDIMVGFAGETEEEFQKSLEFVSKTGFSKVHVFKYSPRKGTKAADMDGQVSSSQKTARGKLMERVAVDSRQKYYDGAIGREYPVLFERRRADGFYYGYTPQYVPVRVRSNADLTGKIVYVRLTSHDGNTCDGQIM